MKLRNVIQFTLIGFKIGVCCLKMALQCQNMLD